MGDTVYPEECEEWYDARSDMADHVTFRVDGCSQSDVLVKTEINETPESHDGAGDVVGADPEVDAVQVTSTSGNGSAIYVAIACIVLFLGAMGGIACYWYCHRMGMKPKSVIISSTEIPAALKGKKYRDHTQLNVSDDGGYDMRPLHTNDARDGSEESEEEESPSNLQTHDILEEDDEDGAFMTGTTR